MQVTRMPTPLQHSCLQKCRYCTAELGSRHCWRIPDASTHRFGNFSEELVRNYTRQLLLGLEYLHEKK